MPVTGLRVFRCTAIDISLPGKPAVLLILRTWDNPAARYGLAILPGEYAQCSGACAESCPAITVPAA